MKREVAVILAVAEGATHDLGVLERWWRWTQLTYAKSVAVAFQGDEASHVKILVSKGEELADKIRQWGCETFEIDFSVASNLTTYLTGVSGVFIITGIDYKKKQPLNAEVEIGRGIAEACLEVGVSHVIYSSLAHVSACIGLRSDACDAKAHISDFMDKIGLPKTILYLPFLYEDFFHGFMRPMPTKSPEIYRIVAPIGHIPMDMLAAEDVGKCVKKLFENSATWKGKTVALSGDKMTLGEFASQMTDITYPKIIRDGKVTPEEFLSIFEAPGAEDLANYFDYMTRSVQKNNLSITMNLNEDVVSFYDWVRNHKEEISGILAQPVVRVNGTP